MTIRHHPGDEVLLELAAGRLAAGPALLVSTHVEMCPRCQERLRTLEMLGGAFMEGLEPEPLRPQALACVLAAIDALPDRGSPVDSPSFTASRTRPAWPPGVPWPRALDACRLASWKWIGPGMYWSRVVLPADPSANVFLLRIGAGKRLPMHTHSGFEWTQVLHGAFHDGREGFGPGDFDGAGSDVHHQPVVQADGECICLAAVEGRVVFDGAVARLFGALVGM
ncbi:ChrR family anti-sigma-E factor [Acidovorax sp. NCPPB 2350]|nr:ChrR family anti-sigma-E factor [Acidovorax sp. NCPPB 2350]